MVSLLDCMRPDWIPVVRVQELQALLVFAAEAGSVALVDLMLNSFDVFINGFCFPVVCMECDPVVTWDACTGHHGIGKESPLLGAARCGKPAVVAHLLSLGANANVANQVLLFACTSLRVFVMATRGDESNRYL
jgi:hypothetical protein